MCSELQSINFFFLKQVNSGQVANVRGQNKHVGNISTLISVNKYYVCKSQLNLKQLSKKTFQLVTLQLALLSIFLAALSEHGGQFVPFCRTITQERLL